MSIRLKQLLEEISTHVEGKRILAIECQEQEGFVMSEELILHLDDGTRVEIEIGYVYDVKVTA